MKLSKRQLRKLINEEKRKLKEGCGGGCGGESEVVNVLEPIYAPMEDAEMMSGVGDTPCPYSTAENLKASGMGPQEVLQWVNTMLSSYNAEGEFEFTGDVGELGGDEAFGVGYEAGTRGL
jgi:hypothetical protein